MSDLERSLPSDEVAVRAPGLSSTKKVWFQPPSHVVVKDIIRGTDGLVLIAASAIERMPAIQTALSSTTDHNHLLANIIGGCVAYGILGGGDGHKISVLKSYKKQFTRVLAASLLGAASVYTSLLALHHSPIELYTGSIRWLILSGSFLAVSRLATTPIIRSWANKGLLAKRIALVGINEISDRFMANAVEHHDICRVVALYDDEETHAHAIQENTRMHGGVDQVLVDSQAHPYDAIVITKIFENGAEFGRIYDLIKTSVADIQIAGNVLPYLESKQDLSEVGGNLVVTLSEKPLRDWQIFYKSIFDRTIGLIALIMLSPIIIGAAIAIKIDSKGPVFFRQPRVGFNNLLFGTYKFRTMYHHLADHRADVQTVENDPRITKIGKYLRKYSIDELAQLINVVKGDMSLVGPRPHAPGTKAAGELFHNVVPDYNMRHRVKPGITGWAQVNGFRGETKTVESIIKRVEYDLYYIKNWSIFFDIKIMILTVLREIKSKNAF